MPRLLLALLCLGCGFRADAAVDPALLALNCLTCHREASAPAADVPALAGLSASQIRQDLLDFKYLRKPATLMSRIAKGFSDEELRAVADYLAQR